jgi:hypothetical protein
MTEYACSGCEYTSYLKEHVLRHINKKKSCVLGIKEVVEIPIEIKCEFCNKNFESKASLNYHTKNTCKKINEIKDKKIEELEKKLKKMNEFKNEKTDEETDEDYEYIYLVKLYPFTDGLFKLGRTKNILERLASYKRYKIVCIKSCLNCIECEKDLLKIFRLKTIENKNMGNEYFNGKWEEMQQIIDEYFMN